jgi:hypothetical protein
MVENFDMHVVDGERQSGKANWDSASHSIFRDVCVEEVRANNHPDAYLSPLGYDNLIRKFNEHTKRNYLRMQLKNRWDACRKKYSMWKTLLQKASSLGNWWALELNILLLSYHFYK